MWALEWVLGEGRWQAVVDGVVSAAAQRLNEPAHVPVLLWSSDPAGVGALTCLQGFILSLSPQPAHGEWCSGLPPAALQPGTLVPMIWKAKIPIKYAARALSIFLCSLNSLRILWRGQETLVMLIWQWPCGELALLPCVNFVSLERAMLCAQPPKQG